MSGVEPRALSPAQPAPEDLFLAWFLRLPHGADVTQAARLEIARLDRERAFCETTHRYRIMLEQASAGPPHLRPGRRSIRH
jgi:hypothetical protein